MDNDTDNNDGSENSTPINTLLHVSRNKIKGIQKSFNAVKTAALNSITNNNIIGNPSTCRDIDTLYFNRHDNNKLQNIGSKYDPNLLMFRRMVCSENVTKNRLCVRDENTQISFDKANLEAEEDETFFENLKRRIGNDIKSKLANPIETLKPRRSSTVKKRKSAFNNECLNLMKKCRAQNLGNYDKSSSSLDNGIFAMENNRKIKNLESIVTDEMLNKSESFLMPNKAAIHMLVQNDEEDDDDLRCATPPGVKGVNNVPET